MSTQPTTAYIVPAAFFSAAGYMPREWTGRGLSAGHDLQLGLLRISTTDQTYRGCGWCWHVCIDTTYQNESIAQDGGCASDDEAKAAGIAWVRRHCEETLAALTAVA